MNHYNIELDPGLGVTSCMMLITQSKTELYDEDYICMYVCM